MDEWLPMIHRDDLVRGLVALMDTPRQLLREPDGGCVHLSMLHDVYSPDVN